MIDPLNPTAARPLSLPVDARRGFELTLCNLRVRPSAQQLTCLSDGERAKAARFVFERDRQRYVAAHVVLRHLLAAKCTIAPGALQFSEGPYGKPALTGVHRCSFNLSHSEDSAVVLVAPSGELGVDVEVLRPMRDALALAERNFSRSENAQLRSVPEAARDHAFLTGWTRKEACLKAIGSGLSIAPDTFTAGIEHPAAYADIPTQQGRARVRVVSFCHDERLLIACAALESLG